MKIESVIAAVDTGEGYGMLPAAHTLSADDGTER
jgi:hypothetical protein